MGHSPVCQYCFEFINDYPLKHSRIEPIAFVHSYGQGRVFNYELGHDVKALEPAPVRRLFARGAEWAATGAVKD